MSNIKVFSIQISVKMVIYRCKYTIFIPKRIILSFNCDFN